MIRQAFTLIELLVVITIILILMGMMALTTETEPAWLVNSSAVQIEATLNKARMLARKTNKQYAVTFNIENVGDGRVIRNFSENDPADFPGRQWWAIIGPTESNSLGGRMPPMPNSKWGTGYADYRKEVEQAMVGGRQYLPRGVRFLSLADYDFVTWFGNGAWNDPVRDKIRKYLYGYAAGSWQKNNTDPWLFFPRPWFGVLIPEKQLPDPMKEGKWMLFPWGGYSPEVETETFDGASGFGGHGNPVLVDGLSLECGLVFTSEGQVNTSKIMQPRAAYSDHFIYDGYAGSFRAYASQPDCMEHPFYWENYISTQHTTPDPASGIQHDIRSTGGYHITVCRDVDEQEDIYPVPGRYDIFDSLKDAEQSIYPLARVFIDRASGSTEVRMDDHPFCERHMNQRRLRIDEIPGLVSELDGGKATTRSLPRPAYKNTLGAERIPSSLQDVDYHDGPGGWQGWHPPYEDE